jgi:hypothetical protein
MKEQFAKQIAKQIRKLPDNTKRDFMKKFYEKNKDNPDVDKLCEQLKEQIGYGKDDFR